MEIDYTIHMRVEVVQYYCKHRARMRYSSDVADTELILAYVLWKQPHKGFHGIPATVCPNLPGYTCPFNFKSVQLIHTTCAHAVLKTEIGNLTEKVFIAVPLPHEVHSIPHFKHGWLARVYWASITWIWCVASLRRPITAGIIINRCIATAI